MSRGKPYEVVYVDRERGEVTLSDKDTGALTSFRPVNDDFFDALDTYQRQFVQAEESE